MNNIEIQFIPYELALEMKLLGFDEPCLGATFIFNNKINEFITFCPTSRAEGYKNSDGEQAKILLENEYYISRPTFSQAFKFFREKYNLNSFIIDSKSYDWYFNINDMVKDDVVSEVLYFKTFEEAELECIKKLIEITQKT